MLKQALLILAWACASTTYAASIYKWVDEKGHTQYSATPPPQGTPYESFRAPSTPGGGPEAGTPSWPKPTGPSEKTSADTPSPGEPNTEATKDRETLWAENCKLAQTNLAVLESDRDVIQTDPEGNKTVLSQAQREQAVGQAKKDLEYYCNP